MKKYILSSMLALVCSYQVTMAQRFNSLETNSGKNLFTDGLWKIFFQHTTLSGTHTDTHRGPGIGMGLRRESIQKYGWRWDYELSAINYAFNMLYTTLKTKNGSGLDYTNNHSLLTSGILGWHKGTINVVATDRLLISPGFSAGDHYISTKLNGTQRIQAVVGSDYLGGPVQSIDPAGWYGYAGPALKASYVVNSKMWVDAYANYDFTVVKFFSPSNDYKKNPDYPMPTVLMYGADVYSTYGVFAGLRLATITDKGEYKNDTKRVDITVGYQF